MRTHLIPWYEHGETYWRKIYKNRSKKFTQVSCISIHLWVYCRFLLKHCVRVAPSTGTLTMVQDWEYLGIYFMMWSHSGTHVLTLMAHQAVVSRYPLGGSTCFKSYLSMKNKIRWQREDTINNWTCILNLDKSICHCHIRYWIVADFVSLCKDWWFSNQLSQEHAY